MKAFPESPTEVGFTPVNVTIKFETQEELDAFGSLFNVTAVVRPLERVAPTFKQHLIRNAVENVGGNYNRFHDDILDGVRKESRL